MRKPKAPAGRDYAVAQNILLGQSGVDACLNAGYSEKTAYHNGHKIIRRDAVKQAMLEIARDIRPGELGGLAKALLQNELLDPPENARERVQVIRLGLEADGMVGQREEIHLHQHTVPPAVEKLLEEKMRELIRVQPQIAEVVSE